MELFLFWKNVNNATYVMLCLNRQKKWTRYKNSYALIDDQWYDDKKSNFSERIIRNYIYNIPEFLNSSKIYRVAQK